VKAPVDVIKLQDRLLYALQPPLEAWLTSEQLQLPLTPFAYQFAGVAFLYPRYSAILADEMGLGKTMQAITAMRLLLHRGEIRSALLVCPKPLVTNWQREFGLWAPELPLTVVEGDQARRQWQWLETSAPITIANYEVLVRDREIVTARGLHFDLVVLDEAQRIKNRSSTTAEVARSLGRSRNWALTGTPIENSIEDLVGIFDFLAPGHVSRHMKPRTVARAVADHVLRRTKRQVLKDLPPLLIRDAELTLTPDQQASYELAENDGVVRLESLGSEITIQHVFELVLRLKQICNFDPATGESAKLERLVADLEEVAASGQKAIVFSQWVQTISRLADHLKPFGVLEYHGQIGSRQREAVLARFKEDPRQHVLLMSYGAGAVGLNLQFASYVFLFDRWWNPAVEDQAINRAHRIGASGPVTVTRFMTLGTIEERIEQILREKRELFDMILSDAGPASVGLSQAEIFGLFRLRGSSGPMRAAA
jgi:SNF2 family DNA or RNA helicase